MLVLSFFIFIHFIFSMPFAASFLHTVLSVIKYKILLLELLLRSSSKGGCNGMFSILVQFVAFQDVF